MKEKISLVIKQKSTLLLLFLILILGFFLRSYHLSSNPVGFFCDEASIGYNAFSILTTGKDEHGVSFPLFFEAFGDYKTPIAIYATIPSIMLFGLTEFSTRLPSVIFGLLTIFGMYFLGKELYTTKRSLFGLLSAFILATMPWLIHYNRVAFQLNVYCAFFVGTLYLFLKARTQKNYLLPAFFVAAVTLYTYQSAQLMIPLLLIGLVIIYRKEYSMHKNEVVVGSLLFIALSLPLIQSFSTGEGLARFNAVSIFSAKLSFGETILRFLNNYFVQLSPAYFISGEPMFITRHFMGGLTPLLITTIPFLAIGVIESIITLKKKRSQLLIYLLLLYPLAGAFTAMAPFTSRSVVGALLCTFFISSGVMITVSLAKKSLHRLFFLTFIVVVMLINVACFARFYFVHYPLYSADYWGWQYGAREIISYFVVHQDTYDDLVMSTEFNSPRIFFKFYAPNDCAKCKTGSPADFYKEGRKQLYALPPKYMAKNDEYIYHPIKNIYYPNGDIAFILSEVTK